MSNKKVRYTIHNYAGTKHNKTVTVSGKIAELVEKYRDKQKDIGITILEDKKDA